MMFRVLGPYTSKNILQRPKLKKRLEQLTNGGFGRRGSTLYPLLQHLTAKSKHKFWLAWRKGEVIGWIWLEAPSKRTFYMNNRLQTIYVSTIGTFVHHDFRRKGVGTRLLDRLAKQTPKKVLFVEEAWNQAGINFYEKISDRKLLY